MKMFSAKTKKLFFYPIIFILGMVLTNICQNLMATSSRPDIQDLEYNDPLLRFAQRDLVHELQVYTPAPKAPLEANHNGAIQPPRARISRRRRKPPVKAQPDKDVVKVAVIPQALEGDGVKPGPDVAEPLGYLNARPVDNKGASDHDNGWWDVPKDAPDEEEDVLDPQLGGQRPLGNKDANDNGDDAWWDRPKEAHDIEDEWKQEDAAAPGLVSVGDTRHELPLPKNEEPNDPAWPDLVAATGEVGNQPRWPGPEGLARFDQRRNEDEQLGLADVHNEQYGGGWPGQKIEPPWVGQRRNEDGHLPNNQQRTAYIDNEPERGDWQGQQIAMERVDQRQIGYQQLGPNQQLNELGMAAINNKQGRGDWPGQQIDTLEQRPNNYVEPQQEKQLRLELLDEYLSQKVKFGGTPDDINKLRPSQLAQLNEFLSQKVKFGVTPNDVMVLQQSAQLQRLYVLVSEQANFGVRPLENNHPMREVIRARDLLSKLYESLSLNERNGNTPDAQDLPNLQNAWYKNIPNEQYSPNLQNERDDNTPIEQALPNLQKTRSGMASSDDDIFNQVLGRSEDTQQFLQDRISRLNQLLLKSKSARTRTDPREPIPEQGPILYADPNPMPNVNINLDSNPNLNPNIQPHPNPYNYPNPNTDPRLNVNPNIRPNPNFNIDHNPNINHRLNVNPNLNLNHNIQPNPDFYNNPNPNIQPNANLYNNPYPNINPNINFAPNRNPNLYQNPNFNENPKLILNSGPNVDYEQDKATWDNVLNIFNPDAQGEGV